MITGELKSKVDQLWLKFHSAGTTDGLNIITHITYLMFMRDLDLNDQKRAKDALFLRQKYKSIFDGQYTVNGRTFEGNDLRWSVFKDFPAEKQYEYVTQGAFNFIKNIQSDKNSSFSKFMVNATFSILGPDKLAEIITLLEEIYTSIEHTNETDVKGDIYEYFLSKIAKQGSNGQFRTPRHIIKMIVEMMNPTSKDLICDPACGTAGFILAAAEHVYNKMMEDAMSGSSNFDSYNPANFTGYDSDFTMLRIGAMNMISHGIELPEINYMNSVSKNNTDIEKYSMILANPPFKGTIEEKDVSPDLLSIAPTKKSELLFLALFLRSLKIGGRCASIVPEGVVNNDNSKAYVMFRKELVEHQKLEAVISMPEGIFKPYSGVSTAILIFTKTNRGGTDNVWFYDMKADGYSLNDKREPIEESDIPDILARFKDPETEMTRSRTDQSFMVPKKEIVEKEYQLNIKEYKEQIFEKIDYPPSEEIVNNMILLSTQLTAELQKLRDML